MPVGATRAVAYELLPYFSACRLEEDVDVTPREIALVQQTWLLLVPIQDQAAELFYDRLFELDPRLRGLFAHDLREQRRKLMTMLGAAVGGLSQPELLLPAVRELGVRHAGYGVKDADYQTVAMALLWTLEQGLGPTFTMETRAAWTAAYQLLAGTMQQAAAAAATMAYG
jgi:hemoglobin-like flavoprotein